MRAGPRLTIGGLAKATGCNAETIRYYERVGVLPEPARTAGNYRSYGPEHVARLTFVCQARGLGFPLKAVREMLRMADEVGRDSRAAARIAQAHLAEVERKIAVLKSLARELRHLAGEGRSGTASECHIIEALTPRPGRASRRVTLRGRRQA